MLKVKFDNIIHSTAISEAERAWLDNRLGEWMPVASISFDEQTGKPYIVAMRSDTESLVACVFLDYPATIYTIMHGDIVLYTNKED